MTLSTLPQADALTISQGRNRRHGTAGLQSKQHNSGLAADLKTEKDQEGGERERELVRGKLIEPQEGFNHLTVSFLLEENAGIVMATVERSQEKVSLNQNELSKHEHRIAAT